MEFRDNSVKNADNVYLFLSTVRFLIFGSLNAQVCCFGKTKDKHC